MVHQVSANDHCLARPHNIDSHLILGAIEEPAQNGHSIERASQRAAGSFPYPGARIRTLRASKQLGGALPTLSEQR